MSKATIDLTFGSLFAKLPDVQQNCDILIAGAGPAGALSARLIGLRRPELKIILLDSHMAPQHRPCGEYLAPGGLEIIERAQLTKAVRATGAIPLYAVTMNARHGGWRAAFAPVLGLHPFCDHGLGVRRERFDAVLQDGAAAVSELRRGHRLVNFTRQHDDWLVSVAGPQHTYHVTAKLLIGADGRGSVVRRRMGLDRPPGIKRIALVTRARRITHRDHVEMHLGPLGQIGLCPLGDGEVNLNLLLAPPSTILLRLMKRDDLLRAALAVTPTLAHRCRAADLGPVMASGLLPQRAEKVMDRGFCLVGDAAGFCDPFTGEGMSIAACGAGLLSETVSTLDFTHMPTTEALTPYAQSFAKIIGRRRSVGELLQNVLNRRRASESLARLIGRVPLLARLLVADSSGFKRLILTKI